MASKSITAVTHIEIVVEHRCGPWGPQDITMGDLQEKAIKEAKSYAAHVVDTLRQNRVCASFVRVRLREAKDGNG